MTNAVFKKEGRSAAAEISGHAGYEKGGADIVCAACSMLAYTLLRQIAEEERKGIVTYMCADVSGGRVFISAEWSEEGDERLSAVFDTVKTGFYMLMEEYPEFVRAEER